MARNHSRSDVESALARSVHDEIYGLGRVQVFIDHPDVVDVHIPGPDSIFMTLTDGSKIRGPSVVDSDAELNALVSRQARRAGRSERRFDREEVDLDLRLPNGARLHALREVTGRTVVDIRQHRWEIGWLDQLVDCDEIDVALAGFLAAAVRARFNIVVAGGTAAGKTTMLRCLINEIPAEERIITVEDSLELGIERFAELHPDHESIEARKPNSEGKGAFTLSEALRSSLRMMDSAGGRVIVGEVRGYEVIPMLKAMTQGNDGSMCTVHGSSARDALGRLQLYALEAPEHLAHEVSAPYIAAGVHFVVYLEPCRRDPPGPERHRDQPLRTAPRSPSTRSGSRTSPAGPSPGPGCARRPSSVSPTRASTSACSTSRTGGGDGDRAGCRSAGRRDRSRLVPGARRRPRGGRRASATPGRPNRAADTRCSPAGHGSPSWRRWLGGW